jgi:hypothetical protein
MFEVRKINQTKESQKLFSTRLGSHLNRVQSLKASQKKVTSFSARA